MHQIRYCFKFKPVFSPASAYPVTLRLKCFLDMTMIVDYITHSVANVRQGTDICLDDYYQVLR